MCFGEPAGIVHREVRGSRPRSLNALCRTVETGQPRLSAYRLTLARGLRRRWTLVPYWTAAVVSVVINWADVHYDGARESEQPAPAVIRKYYIRPLI